MRIPVPKKKDDATEMPKYLLKIMLRKVKRLAQPSDIMILPRFMNYTKNKTTVRSIKNMLSNV